MTNDQISDQDVIPEQDRIEIYRNPSDAIVIKGSNVMGEESYVILQPEYVARFVSILNRVTDNPVKESSSRDEAKSDNGLQSAVVEFLNDFERVFEEDWEHTFSTLQNGDYIKKGHSFLEPGVEDESNNWWNRGSLLDSYRTLKAALTESGTESKADA